MLAQDLVVDAVVHGYNFAPDNRIGGKYADAIVDALWSAHQAWSPSERWVLGADRLVDAPVTAELLGGALFAESDTDACIYHETAHWGLFRDGGSPLAVGRQMRQAWPDRVFLYGGVSPWQDDALDVVDRLVEEDEVVGIKFYPLDLVNGELRSMRMDDRRLLYPLLQHILDRGIRTVAVHKAIPYGPVPMEPFRMDDLDWAIVDFPELTFEVVHGGLAFLEETCAQLARFPNLVVNLEGTTGLLASAPRRFAEVLGAMLAHGGADRILWSTGAALLHPQPLLEIFHRFQIPEDLAESYGYPQLTPEVRRGILGMNACRVAGIDAKSLGAVGRQLPTAQFAEPWTGGVT